MNVAISDPNKRPIYEQISERIKSQIIEGQLIAGDVLPSIRALAMDLKVSTITTQRAYRELESEGLIVTVPGKGSFVSMRDRDTIRETGLVMARDHLEKAVAISKSHCIKKEELSELLDLLFEK
jgi:GntR family transcriptional regulator